MESTDKAVEVYQLHIWIRRISPRLGMVSYTGDVASESFFALEKPVATLWSAPIRETRG